MSGSRVTCVKVKGLGHIRIPKKGRWAHNNVKLLHLEVVQCDGDDDCSVIVCAHHHHFYTGPRLLANVYCIFNFMTAF